HLADAIHESQGGLEIGEFVSAHEVMLVDDLPLRGLCQLRMNLGEFVSLERGHTAATGDAISICKREVSHGVSDAVNGRAGAELRLAWTGDARPHPSKD
ncbi:MAG TPA: hypothetical protein VKD23_00980, partial [Terriglobales bacterium]|nr:hypothetical protein [Terriglobales bacterium]